MSGHGGDGGPARPSSDTAGKSVIVECGGDVGLARLSGDTAAKTKAVYVHRHCEMGIELQQAPPIRHTIRCV